MQSALDATALMISRDAASLSEAEILSRAQAYFNALYTYPDAAIAPISIKYTPNTGKGATVVVEANGSIKTEFMKIAGFSSLDFGSSATTTWGSARLRVALVLDTTGSMKDAGKIGALQSATKDLLGQLEKAANKPEDVYVSIIPFSKNVNLGASNYNASWIDWTSWEAEPVFSKPSNWDQIGPGSTCPFKEKDHGFRCANRPATASGASNTTTIPSSGTYAGYICPTADTGGRYSEKIGIHYNGCYNSIPTTKTVNKTVSSGSNASCSGYSNCTCSGSGRNKVCTQQVTETGAPYTHEWVVNARSTWNGCVTDRGTTSAPSGDYDRLVTAPNSSNPASLFPAEQNLYCSPKVTGLSNNWTTLKTEAESLYPLGATNQPIGLVWGWQSLVGGGPLTVPTKDENYPYIDVIVLMSDGLNTLNRWYGDGSTTSPAVDARMYNSNGQGTCANAKEAGTIIYTIHVNTDGSEDSKILENCATSKAHFFPVGSAGGIAGAFTQIGTQLSMLRISK